MEEKDSTTSEKELYIPVPIPDSDDYISGIGKKEVAIILIASLIATVIGVLLSVFGNTIVGVGTGAFIISTAITLVRRDMYNENFIKKVLVFNKFLRAQKKFVYVFKNEFDTRFDEKNEGEDDE